MDTAIRSWQCIDTTQQRQTGIKLLECLTGSECRTVVMAEHGIDSVQVASPFLYTIISRFFSPVALNLGHHLDVGIICYGYVESVVAFLGRLRAFRSRNLDDITLAA